MPDKPCTITYIVTPAVSIYNVEQRSDIVKRMLLVVATILCFVSSALAEPGRVFDNAGLFTKEEIDEIEQAISAFQRDANMDFAILTTDDYLGSTNQKKISDSFFLAENIGFGRDTHGMLYYIDANQFMHRITTGGDMVDLFNDEEIATALDACAVFLADNDNKGAVLKMIDIAREQVTGAK